jgi:hypothetical protein
MTEMRNNETQTELAILNIRILVPPFVSDFDIRISNFI